LDGLRFLGKKKIPFVRFWACSFWPAGWDLYFKDKKEWFRRLDMVVKTAEEADVALIPSLFWRNQTYPDLFDEYLQDWGNPNSKTRAFMRKYTREVVTRYKNSPAIWGWEFSNEMNLGCDLPNGMEFLGEKNPKLKVNLEKDTRNLITHKIAADAFNGFAEEVRKYDKYRFITTGNSRVRPAAYHISTSQSWVEDNSGQAFTALKWFSPDSMNVVSVHSYGEEKYAGKKGLRNVLGLYKYFAEKLRKPLLIGEFAGISPNQLEKKHLFRKNMKIYFDTILNKKIDLAAYWVFDYTPNRKEIGLVRKDNEYAWVLDEIIKYNKKINDQLQNEKKN